MRISDWISDVCSSDLADPRRRGDRHVAPPRRAADDAAGGARGARTRGRRAHARAQHRQRRIAARVRAAGRNRPSLPRRARGTGAGERSEEHTSELQSLMRISYAVFCLKKKKTKNRINEKDKTK